VTRSSLQDYGPEETRVREQVLGTIVDVFKRHGAVSIETPVFELKEVLVGQVSGIHA
jgi:histidyl-tRNA synthetase